MTQEEFKNLAEKYEQAKELEKKISDLKKFLEEVDGKDLIVKCYIEKKDDDGFLNRGDINYVNRLIEKYFGKEKFTEIVMDILKRRVKFQLEDAEQEFAELKVAGERK